jgi:hypothetical protein
MLLGHVGEDPLFGGRKISAFCTAAEERRTVTPEIEFRQAARTLACKTLVSLVSRNPFSPDEVPLVSLFPQKHLERHLRSSCISKSAENCACTAVLEIAISRREYVRACMIQVLFPLLDPLIL